MEKAPLPLHIYVTKNQVEKLKYLLDLEGTTKLKLEAKNVHGETPLHLACKHGFNEVIELLLSRGADLEARTNNMSSPLHLAVDHSVQTGDNSTLKKLLAHGADCNAKDSEGLTPTDYLPKGPQVFKLLLLNINKKSTTSDSDHTSIGNKNVEKPMDIIMEEKMREFEYELSKIVGVKELKCQLRVWAKGMLADEARRARGLISVVSPKPHMVFLGNPGTGKTLVARTLGKLFKSVGGLSSDKVTEVQRSDLVAESVGQTAIKTKKKIKEAMGGVLFVNHAYRLAPAGKTGDFGVEALEEIKSVMKDNRELMVVFAGYTEPMERFFSSDERFYRQVARFFKFDDFTCNDLAEMLMLKMDEHRRLYGFKLHHSCTLGAIREVIEKNTTEELRSKINGDLVDRMLNNARENLESRLSSKSSVDELLTISLLDLEAGLKQVVYVTRKLLTAIERGREMK